MSWNDSQTRLHRVKDRLKKCSKMVLHPIRSFQNRRCFRKNDRISTNIFLNVTAFQLVMMFRGGVISNKTISCIPESDVFINHQPGKYSFSIHISSLNIVLDLVVKNRRIRSDVNMYCHVIMSLNRESQAKEFSIFRIMNSTCLLYTSPSPRDLSTSRMPSSA